MQSGRDGLAVVCWMFIVNYLKQFIHNGYRKEKNMCSSTVYFMIVKVGFFFLLNNTPIR